MSAVSSEHGTFTLDLSEEERGLLSSVLEQVLRDKQIESHRTDSIEYRGHLDRQEALLRGLVDKVRRV